jgi:hypothetical protein
VLVLWASGASLDRVYGRALLQVRVGRAYCSALPGVIGCGLMSVMVLPDWSV